MSTMKQMPGFAGFILFVALCASAAYWFLQLWHPPARAVAAPVAVATSGVSIDTAAGLFGGRPVAVGVASNYQLRGVVVAKNGRESVAILSTDGKPAQAVGIDTEFQPGVMVREVHPQYVLLSEGGVIKRVALPEGARGAGADITQMTVPTMPGASAASIPTMPAMPAMPTTPILSPVQPQMTQQLTPLAPGVPQPANQPQPPPQLQALQQAANQGGQPMIGQMSTQLSQPVQGQVNGSGQQVVPTGQPVNPAGTAPTMPPQSGGTGGYSQQRRQ
jgi:general secretion pathway protein C